MIAACTISIAGHATIGTMNFSAIMTSLRWGKAGQMDASEL
jgi:hypothetical protein